MDECVARRREAVEHWHGGMESGRRSHGEGQARKREEGREGRFFIKIVAEVRTGVGLQACIKGRRIQ